MEIYKLNILYPWWCSSFKSHFPIDHVETIVAGVKEIYGVDLWEKIEINNFEWKSEQEVWMVGTVDTLPQYIKLVKGSTNYYFDLYDRSEIISEDESGIMYRGKYLIDNYMTKYNKKLHCLIDANPVVKFKRKYCDRFKKDSDNNWYVDFIEQKYLSSYSNMNTEKVRKLAYYTTEAELYTNNFSSYEKPTTRTLNHYTGSETWQISNFKTLLETPSNTGRYRYLVCKSSAKISTNNSKITPTQTSQTILVIPLWSDEVLHAINDIDITGTQTGALSPLGENLIGFWESDLPYSFLYGMERDSSTAITMKYAANVCYGASPKNIPFWEIPLNYYKKYKLIDYLQYSQGFAGKIAYMIQNLTRWIPETEPALYAPQNYQEVYNNGVGSITNDLSYFIFKWTGSSLQNFKQNLRDESDSAQISMYATFGFDDGLHIAYDFGEFTNTKLVSYDNTEVITSSVSIQNQFAGSASANYYANNVNTGLTSVQNRKSEQDQARIDTGLNTGKAWNNVAPDSIVGVFNPFGWAKRTVNAALDTAKMWVDYAKTQERENRQLASNVNNIYSSPASIIGNPYIKGIIPNNNRLFETFAFELHPYDKAKVFGDILQYGRVYDTLDRLNAFDNNIYMNILDIDPYVTYYRLLRIILENDDTIFNTQADNDAFFTWLGSPHQIFNTWYPINCINYQGDDYIDNVEKTIYPTLKIHISTLIKNIPTHLKAEESLCIAELQAANPDAPAALWNDIEIVSANYQYVTIKAKDSSTTYTGTMIKEALCYNATCTLDSGIEYVYDFNKVFKGSWIPPTYLVFESGKQVKYNTFNSPITFNTLSSITEFTGDLLNGFLAGASAYNQPITIPNNITKIGANFLYIYKTTGACAFNSTINIGNITEIEGSFLQNQRFFNQSLDCRKLTSIGGDFLSGCTSFNQPIQLPLITMILAGFMYNCNTFKSTIEIDGTNLTKWVADDSLVNLYDFSYENGGNLILNNVNTSVITSGDLFFYVNKTNVSAYTSGFNVTGNSASTFKIAFPEISLSTQTRYRKYHS